MTTEEENEKLKNEIKELKSKLEGKRKAKKKIAFILSMPNVGSWNRKWTSEDRVHARVFDIGERAVKHLNLKEGNYRYDFGDGWCACVTVREVDSMEARKLKKASVGFCGYDWMIDEIKYHGRIRTQKERKENKQ